MKKVDKKKFITKSKVVSDIRRIQNKFYKELDKLLAKYGNPTSEEHRTTKPNILTTKNIKLKRESVNLENTNKMNDNTQKTNSVDLTPADRKKLSTMGNSWFVSYLYHFQHSDHKNWKLTMQGFRTGTFRKTRELGLHKRYLEAILKANEASLGTNQINLSGARIKEMAKELLDNWETLIKSPEYVKV